MNQRGTTLVESLVALAVLGMVAVAILPAYMQQASANGRAEIRSGAVVAVQRQLETLRLIDPATLPTSGTSAPQLQTIDGRDFGITTTYCADATYCGTGSRHLLVEAFLDGQKIFDAETVYTQLL